MTTEARLPSRRVRGRRLIDLDLYRWREMDGNSVMANRYERAAISFTSLLRLIAQDFGVAP